MVKLQITDFSFDTFSQAHRKFTTTDMPWKIKREKERVREGNDDKEQWQSKLNISVVLFSDVTTFVLCFDCSTIIKCSWKGTRERKIAQNKNHCTHFIRLSEIIRGGEENAHLWCNFSSFFSLSHSFPCFNATLEELKSNLDLKKPETSSGA